jgi:Na+/H+-dicarboxylate symporter
MKKSLNQQILAGALVGITGGVILHFLGPDAAVTSLLLFWCGLAASIFVGLLKMVMIPLIFFSIATGVANLQTHTHMRRIWGCTLAYSLSTCSLAVLLGLSAVNLFKPGVGLHLDLFKNAAVNLDAKSMTVAQFGQSFIEHIFTNPIGAMARGEVLPTVVFAMIFGFAIGALKHRARTTHQVFVEIFEIIMMVIGWIMRLAPVGIAALLIKLIATQDVTLLKSLVKFIGVVVGATLIHGLFVLPLVLWMITKISPFAFFKGMADALITAFSTSSSSATMPVTLRCLKDNLKADPSIAGFVIPMGMTLNMDGTAMYEAVAAIFVANLAGIELNLVQQMIVFATAMAASIGAPGIPSAGMVTMIMVLQSVGLPLEAVALLIPIDRPLDTIRTVVNVEGDAVGALVVQKLISQDKGIRDKG